MTANYVREVAKRLLEALPPDSVPESDAESLLLLYALLALAKGESVTREDVHDAWVTWMTLIQKTHPSMRPFSELPRDVQEEDEPFRRAIIAVARDEDL